MRNLWKLFLLIGLTSFFVACASVVEVDGKRVSYTYPALGGKTLSVINHIEGVKMEAKVLEPRRSGDRIDRDPANTGEALQFFFARQAYMTRDRVTILLVFTSAEDGSYVGSKELKVNVRTRGQGDHDSDVVMIRSVQRPRTLR